MSASPALRIAIVEDEAVLAMELEELIAELGHTLAGSAMDAAGAEALGDVAADLAMVDIHLADGPTGVEVGRALASRGIAVVFMTANIKRIPEDYAGALGAIGKPYTQAGFAAALAYIGALLEGDAPTAPPPRSLTIAPGRRSPPSD